MLLKHNFKFPCKFKINTDDPDTFRTIVNRIGSDVFTVTAIVSCAYNINCKDCYGELVIDGKPQCFGYDGRMSAKHIGNEALNKHIAKVKKCHITK